MLGLPPRPHSLSCSSSRQSTASLPTPPNSITPTNLLHNLRHKFFRTLLIDIQLDHPRPYITSPSSKIIGALSKRYLRHLLEERYASRDMIHVVLGEFLIGGRVVEGRRQDGDRIDCIVFYDETGDINGPAQTLTDMLLSHGLDSARYLKGGMYGFARRYPLLCEVLEGYEEEYSTASGALVALKGLNGSFGGRKYEVETRRNNEGGFWSAATRRETGSGKKWLEREEAERLITTLKKWQDAGGTCEIPPAGALLEHQACRRDSFDAPGSAGAGLETPSRTPSPISVVHSDSAENAQKAQWQLSADPMFPIINGQSHPVLPLSPPIPILLLRRFQSTLVNAVWYPPRSLIPDTPLLVYSSFLYLGSRDAAHPSHLKALNISVVIRVGFFNSSETGQDNSSLASESNESVKYYTYHMEDSESEQIDTIFEETSNILESCRKASRNVLVHCHAGVSRSTTLILAYLMSHRHMNLHRAFDMVFRKRPIVRPNEGFGRKLQALEQKLYMRRKKENQEQETEEQEGEWESSISLLWMSFDYAMYREYLELEVRLRLMEKEEGLIVRPGGTEEAEPVRRSTRSFQHAQKITTNGPLVPRSPSTSSALTPLKHARRKLRRSKSTPIATPTAALVSLDPLRDANNSPL